MELILSNAVAVAGVVLFFVLLRTGAGRPARRDPDTGELVLQCGRGLVWTMGGIAAGGPLAMGVLSLVVPFKSTAEALVPVALGGFFLLLGGVMCLWALRRRTRISAEGLTSEYLVARPRFLAWKDVERVTFSGQELWIRGPGRQKALLMVWFVGVRESVPFLRRYLPEAVRKQDAAVLRKFAAAVGAVERRDKSER